MPAATPLTALITGSLECRNRRIIGLKCVSRKVPASMSGSSKLKVSADSFAPEEKPRPWPPRTMARASAAARSSAILVSWAIWGSKAFSVSG